MPKNIVVLFVNEGDVFGTLIRKKMRISNFGPDQQIVKMQMTKTPHKSWSRERQKTFPGRVNRFLRNRSSEAEALDEAKRPNFEPDPTAVADAYRYLEQNHKEGDRIIVVGVGRGLEECKIIRDTILHLAHCLDNGANPSKLSSVPVIKKPASALPIEQPYTASLAGQQILINNITLIHHSKSSDYISYNNELLNQLGCPGAYPKSRRLPLSIERFVSINYAPGFDLTCDIVRGTSGGIQSRKVWFFDTPIWQGSYIIYSTMDYIRYQSQFTNQWLGIRPITTRTLTLPSRPLDLLAAPHCDYVPAYNGSIAPTPSASASASAETMLSDKTSPTSTPTGCQWAPLESDTIEPPGMRALQIHSYRAFRRPEEDDYLPRRVLWSASYSETGFPG